MLSQQAPLQRGGRLPPTPQPEARVPPTALSFQDRMGNAAIQDLLRSGQSPLGPTGPMPGQGGEMSIQQFEEIGESDDEVVVGGELPWFGEHDEDFLYGRGAVDDWSLKAEAGLLRGEERNWGLVNIHGQAGAWYDDQGNTNLGAQGHFGLVEGQYDFLGDQSEDDGYVRVRGGLLAIDAAQRSGTDGLEQGMGLDACYLGIGAGTGHQADSAHDFNVDLTGSVYSVGEGIDIGYADRDQDGVPELELGVGLDIGTGLGVEMSSEVLGSCIQGAGDWLTGGWND